jgi:itaconyl-CoA hydratase
MTSPAAGRFFEDFEVGAVYRASQGRTVTQSDNLWFTLLTNNNNQVHFNQEYARLAGFDDCLVNTLLTVAIVGGLGVGDVSANGINLGMTDLVMLHPVYPGDTLYSLTEVLSIRESRSHPDKGIVTIQTEGYNQSGVCVCRYSRTALVWKRAFAPTHDAFPVIADRSGAESADHSPGASQ